MSEMRFNQDIVAVDLFCGAGGFSEGLRQACRELGHDLKHAAINHWEPAIETHERNHPDAHQYHSKVEQLHPPEVIDALVDQDVTDVHTADVDVDLLVAGPECTHFSSARGGKPVNEQKRMSPWHVLDWLEKLDVDAFIIENVGEIQSWGPVEDGQPTRDGSVFDAWINALNGLGYSVEWTTLTAADYGDPTSRERFFLVGRQAGKATFPEPTHSDSDPDKPDRRTAAEIIDWSDLGTSIWTRDLTEKRVHSPPKNTTMQRIAEGIRRHCDDRLEPFADAIEVLGNGNEDEPVPHTVQDLRDRVVPAAYADLAADALDEPFLVSVPAGTKATAPTHLLRQQDGGHPWSVIDRPVPTIAKKGAHAIATPSLVMPKNYPKRGIHSNGLYRPERQLFHTVTADPRAKLVSPSLIRWSHGGATLDFDDPMPTIATERGGVFSLSSPYLCPLYNPRPGQRPRTRAIDRPMMTIPASKSPAAVTTPLVRPFIHDYEGPPPSVGTPLGTLTKRDRFALCVPELWPWGLDIKYRMLQPRELKQAQGFPDDYDLAGNKADRTEQIGNAVPVTLAKNLCKHVLTAGDPSLASYGGGITTDDGSGVPDYEDVVPDGGEPTDE
jgi:DNA (cytosine-5)-methyltransferase 1